jgi:hypothetical protein
VAAYRTGNGNKPGIIRNLGGTPAAGFGGTATGPAKKPVKSAQKAPKKPLKSSKKAQKMMNSPKHRFPFPGGRGLRGGGSYNFCQKFFRYGPGSKTKIPPNPPLPKGGDYKELLGKSPFEKGGLRGI